MNSPEPLPVALADAGPSLGALRDLDARHNQEAWNRAYPLLWNIAIRLLRHILAGPEHQHDREDIAARALSELVRSVIENKLPSFNQMKTFDDVLHMTQQIVRSRTKDFFRSRGRRPEDLVGEIPETSTMAPASECALNGDEFDRLVGELPPPQPEIFQLHYTQGHTAEEIAIRLAMPRGTVLSHLFRGKKTLRKRIEEQAGKFNSHEGQPPFPHD